MIAPAQAWQSEEYLPDLLIEASRLNGLVQIGQSTGNGEHSAIEIHPSQVLYIAQKLGMVRELSGDEAAAREGLHARIAVLERDLHRLRMALDLTKYRMGKLYENLCLSDEKGHEDLSIEVAQASALVDLLELVCMESEDAPVTDLQRPCNVAGNATVTPTQRSANAASVTAARATAPARGAPAAPPPGPDLFAEARP